MVPLHEDLGWLITTMSAAVSVNLVLYGLTAPFAAALIERFGLRQVTSVALVLIAAGAALSILAKAAWQLLLTWGLLISKPTAVRADPAASNQPGGPAPPAGAAGQLCR